MLKLVLIFIFSTFIYANSANVALYLNSPKLKEKVFIGTGSIISSDGYILSAYHNFIFENFKDIEYLVRMERDYKAKLITFDKELDLALIKIDKKNLNYFNISTNFKLSDRVFALGFSGKKKHKEEGSILAFEKLNEKLKIIKTNAKAKKGQSGGALINKDGDLIGIIFMKESDKDMIYAISSFSIKKFLNKSINSDKNYNFYYLFFIGIVIFAIILKRKPKSFILYREDLKSSYKLNSNLRIGRNDLNEVILSNRRVSKSHAIIKKRRRDFYIKDLNSTNGTFLNGKKLTPFKYFLLKKGDKIDFGLTTIFEIREG